MSVPWGPGGKAGARGQSGSLISATAFPGAGWDSCCVQLARPCRHFRRPDLQRCPASGPVPWLEIIFKHVWSRSL